MIKSFQFVVGSVFLVSLPFFVHVCTFFFFPLSSFILCLFFGWLIDIKNMNALEPVIQIYWCLQALVQQRQNPILDRILHFLQNLRKLFSILNLQFKKKKKEKKRRKKGKEKKEKHTNTNTQKVLFFFPLIFLQTTN